jgi:type IV secretory pathway VirB10-like protein
METKPTPKPHRPMLFVSNKVDREAPDEDTHVLAPAATKLPCVVETHMSSDTGETFTAKIRGHVYDTETGHYLLIPQGSTLLGEYAGASLVFGNERLPTMALSLALPNGRSVDLGKAPVMNQAGMAGLVSDVNNHWWRLIGAALVLGALRGGQQAVYTVVNPGDTAGAIASGLGSATSQVGQQKLGRALDTRPTITVDAGTLCQVILTKPLKLAAYVQQP